MFESTQSYPLEQLYVRTWLKTMKTSRNQETSVVTSDTEKVLSAIGVTEQAIANITRNIDVQDAIVHRGAVINPYFLSAKANKQLHFFLVDARGARYHALQTLLRSVTGGMSYFGLYGPQDSMIFFVGSKDEAKRLLDVLENSRFDPSYLEILDVTRFYGYDLSIEAQRFSKNHRVSPEIINTLVSDYNSRDISRNEKTRLIENGVILGETVIESLAHTGRIKAFVGINFVGRLPVAVTNNLTKYLLELDPIIPETVTKVYRFVTRY
ncbi:MAG: hypothetical protein H6642_02980 [Caldilineaceae bacterium]|nr:hypothetical protein [Caldilineaceae bacterium]